MLQRNRILTVLTTAGYLLVVSGAALFHNHGAPCGHGDDSPRPGVSVSHGADEHECLICQFLAQKPAPAETIAPQSSAPLVHDVALPAPLLVRSVSFTAWHSRAPPRFA